MKNKCYICGKELSPADGMHIYRCAKKHNLNMSKEEIKYNQLCFKFDFKFTFEYLKEKYLKEKWSLPDFKREHGIDYKAMQFLLKYFGLDIRDSSDAKKTNRCKNKYIKTCEEKYGVDNVSKSKIVKEKKKKTFKKNYGVDNIWKSKDYYVWLHDFMLENYGKKSLPNRYGKMNEYWESVSDEYKEYRIKLLNEGWKTHWKNLSDEQKNDLINKRKETWWNSFKDGKSLNYYSSELESRFAKCLTKANYSFKSQFFLNRKSYDFKIDDFKILIEVQGDYWHANPLLYSSDDLLSYPGKKVKAKEVWEKDSKKKKNAQKYGYDILYFWEKDLNDMSDDDIIISIIERLKNEIGKNQID